MGCHCGVYFDRRSHTFTDIECSDGTSNGVGDIDICIEQWIDI